MLHNDLDNDLITYLQTMTIVCYDHVDGESSRKKLRTTGKKCIKDQQPNAHISYVWDAVTGSSRAWSALLV